jgi:hypothetical protein
MTYPKTAPWTPVIVEWEDCEVNATDQHPDVKSALESYKPCLRCSVGFWVGTTESAGRRAVLIATDDDRKSRDGGFGGVIQLPMSMIIKITALGKPLAKTWSPK